MGLDAQPAGDPHHVEAPVALAAGLGQLVAERLDLVGGQLQQLGQQAHRDRLHGHHQDRLDGPGLG